MSESIYVLDLKENPYPKPQTLVDLDRIVRTHQELPYVLNFRFVKLAQALEQQFPWCAREDLTGREEVVWSARPTLEVRSLPSALWHLDVPTGSPVKFLAFLSGICETLGLIVFDTAMGIGFLPDGRTIPADLGRPPPFESAPKPTQGTPIESLSQGLEALTEALRETLEPHGFQIGFDPEWNTEAVVCAGAFGPVSRRVSMSLAYRGGDRFRGTSLTVTHGPTSQAMQQLAGARSHSLRVSDGFFKSMYGPDFCDKKLHVEDIKAFAEMAAGHWLLLADMARDLQGIDQLLNHPSASRIRSTRPDSRRLFARKRTAGSDGSQGFEEEAGLDKVNLLTAYLNGNPHYDRVEERYLTKFRESTISGLEWKRAVSVEKKGITLPHKLPDAEWEATAEFARAMDEHNDFITRMKGTFHPLHVWADVADHENNAIRKIPELLTKTEWHPHETRPHHAAMTGALIHDIEQDPPGFMRRYSQPTAQADLETLWQSQGSVFAPAQQLPKGILRVQRLRLPRAEFTHCVDAIVIQLPKIQGIFEDDLLGIAHSHGMWWLFAHGLSGSYENEQLQHQTWFYPLSCKPDPKERSSGENRRRYSTDSAWVKGSFEIRSHTDPLDVREFCQKMVDQFGMLPPTQN